MTPPGPYALTGTGGACCVNVSPSYENSVMTFVPSERARIHRLLVGGFSAPEFGKLPP